MTKLATMLMIAGLVLFPGVSVAKGLFWVEGNLGRSTYLMDDLNNFITSDNAATGLDMALVQSGFAYGCGAGVNLGPRTALGIGCERLQASSEIGAGGVSLEYRFPANVYGAVVQYTVPSPERFHLLLGEKAGWVSVNGQIVWHRPVGGPISETVSGRGSCVEGRLGGLYELEHDFALVGSVGFALAKVPHFYIDGQRIYQDGGQPMALDYSGLRVRFGVRRDIG